MKYIRYVPGSANGAIGNFAIGSIGTPLKTKGFAVNDANGTIGRANGTNDTISKNIGK